MYASGHQMFTLLSNFSERVNDCDHDLIMEGLPLDIVERRENTLNKQSAQIKRMLIYCSIFYHVKTSIS